MQRDELIGNSKRNLVIKTAGIIRVLVGDKYYDLDFRSKKEEQEDKNEEVTSNFIISESIKPFESGKEEFPGNNKVIFTLDGDIYYTKEGNYIKYQTAVDSGNNNQKSPFIVTSSGNIVAESGKMVSNLNSQFLDGKQASDFIEKSNIQTFNKVVFNELVSSDGSFYYKDGVFSFDRKMEFEYESLDSDTTLSLEQLNYSIKSNGYKVSLPDSENGTCVNIYAIDDIIIDTNFSPIELDMGTYNTLVYIPVGEDSYRWIRVTDNYFIEK